MSTPTQCDKHAANVLRGVAYVVEMAAGGLKDGVGLHTDLSEAVAKLLDTSLDLHRIANRIEKPQAAERARRLAESSGCEIASEMLKGEK